MVLPHCLTSLPHVTAACQQWAQLPANQQRTSHDLVQVQGVELLLLGLALRLGHRVQVAAAQAPPGPPQGPLIAPLLGAQLLLASPQALCL